MQKRKQNPVDLELLKCLKSMQDVNISDEFDTFGFTIAKKLRLLNSVNKKEVFSFSN